MNWRKILKWTGLAVAVLALAGMFGVYRVFRYHYPPLEAILIVQNMTEIPVEVASLTYDDRLLLRARHFDSFEVYRNLKPSRDKVEVKLEIRRPGEPQLETHTFVARQGVYEERCAFQVRIEMSGARMSDCVWFN